MSPERTAAEIEKLRAENRQLQLLEGEWKAAYFRTSNQLNRCAGERAKLNAENERLRADNERLVAVMEALSFASAGRFSITEVETVPIEAMEAAHWEHVRRGTLTMEVIAAAVNVWMDKQKSPGAWADASMYIILPLPAPEKTKP